jgi:hypothetical protein
LRSAQRAGRRRNEAEQPEHRRLGDGRRRAGHEGVGGDLDGVAVAAAVILEQELQIIAAGREVAEVQRVLAEHRPAAGAGAEQIDAVEPGEDAVVDAEAGHHVGRRQRVEAVDNADFGADGPVVRDRGFEAPVGVEVRRVGEPVAERRGGRRQVGRHREVEGRIVAHRERPALAAIGEVQHRADAVIVEAGVERLHQHHGVRRCREDQRRAGGENYADIHGTPLPDPICRNDPPPFPAESQASAVPEFQALGIATIFSRPPRAARHKCNKIRHPHAVSQRARCDRHGPAWRISAEFMVNNRADDRRRDCKRFRHCGPRDRLERRTESR